MIAALKKFFRKEEVDNIRNIIINHGVIIPEEIETGKELEGGGAGGEWNFRKNSMWKFQGLIEREEGV